MKNLIAILIIALLSTPIFAQRYGEWETRIIDIEQYRESFGLNAQELAELEGSPYEIKAFTPGSLFDKDNLVKKNTMLRYNIFADEIEIKDDPAKEEYFALLKSPDYSAKISNNTYVFVPLSGSVEKGGYFIVLSMGNKYDLYKKMEVTYHRPVYAKSSYDKDKPASFTNSAVYYLVDKGGTLYELPASRSKIAKVFANRKKEIEGYIKSNQLNLNDEKDLIKLVNFYNSLTN